MRYLGGKSQGGTWQRIINLIPPHSTFIEPFAGGAAITRLKKPAGLTILVEKSVRQARNLRAIAHATVINGCGMEFLETHKFTANEFVYADPPYVHSTRKSGHRYEHELTDADHERLLACLLRLPCRVLLSAYQSELYSKILVGQWQCEKFEVMTRGHTWATECLWFNYPRPETLHDLSHVGTDYRERWRIEKRRRRWTARLAKLDALERAALFSALVDVMAAAGDSAVTGAAPWVRGP